MKAKRASKRYGTLLFDPPWPEVGGGKITRGAQRHYSLMKVPDIMNMMVRLVQRYALPDAHMYLWTTNNFLEKAFPIIGECGFRYITCLTWFKDKDGLGQYYRGRTEHTLFAICGRPGYRYLPNGKRAQGRTGYHAPRTRHSQKPDQVHQWAEIVSPGPYLELFARDRRPGWDAWGNEV